ncbi:hypothetical protein RINTU1_09040 [Candidatus Regiella insecticola]|uniref:Uncharacterized protein n=1 Tax=Candidatus Regiella insecticola TaxID=138073 RepID=A0A6L2ZN25_9ENTR|nr:hypothetical protein RINTU1_09040 [Candidatus Regiella insecticola]
MADSPIIIKMFIYFSFFEKDISLIGFIKLFTFFLILYMYSNY